MGEEYEFLSEEKYCDYLQQHSNQNVILDKQQSCTEGCIKTVCYFVHRCGQCLCAAVLSFFRGNHRLFII